MEVVSEYRTKLCKGNAQWMALFSKLVYQKTSNINQMPDEEGILAALKEKDADFKTVKGYDKNSAQAMLVEHERYMCMVFRGTNEPADWLDNLSVQKELVLFGEFHKGFWRSVEDVWQIYDDYLELCAEKKRPLFITGHSLGGAMANIAAARLIHIDAPFSSVYTFGQPRALKPETARIFNVGTKLQYFRFCNNNDIVTRVPARIFGYSHTGTFLYITEDKEIHTDIGYWNRFIDQCSGAMSALTEPGVDHIADHDINKYISAIDKWNIRDD